MATLTLHADEYASPAIWAAIGNEGQDAEQEFP
jgi:hypothetical protein